MKIKTSYFFFIFLLLTLNSKAQNKTENLFNKHLKLGHHFIEIGKIDSAKITVKKLESLFNFLNTDSSYYYQKEVLKASVFARNNKSDTAIEILLQAKLFFKQQKDSANCGLTLYILGVANYYVNRRKKAKKYFENTLKFQNHISKKLITKSYQNVGTVNLEIGIITKDNSLILQTIPSYMKAIAIYKKEHWTTEEALVTSLLSECYQRLGDYKKALLTIDKAINLSKKIKNKSQEGFALIKKANFLNEQNQNSKALKEINKAIPIIKKIDNNLTLLYAYTTKKKILFSLKNYKKATIIGDSIYAVSIQNYNTRFADKVSEMDAKYQKVENEKKIAQQKEELLAQKLSIKNRNLYALLITSALLLLGIISFGFYKKNQFKRQQLQKEIDLKDALSKIKTQNRLQEQRLRISRDLHDNIGSQLTFIISSIDNLKFISKDAGEVLKNKLSNISTFTSETISQLRDTIWAMNKNSITSDDLHVRILSYVEKAQIANPKIKFTVDHSVTALLHFNSIEGVNLFRIMQEAINNAIKYAEATKITVFASVKKQQLIIEIKDNGKGFAVNKTTQGNGLQNMEKRMYEIHGKINITSSHKGTSIIVHFPVKNT